MGKTFLSLYVPTSYIFISMDMNVVLCAEK